MKLLVFLGLWLFAMFSLAIGVGMMVWHRRFVAAKDRVLGVTLVPDVQTYQFDDDEYRTRFQYVVQGVTYVGSDGTSNIRWFHRAGRRVWVYYEPTRPAEGTIVEWYVRLIGVVPILLAAYIVALLIFGKSSHNL